MTTPLAGRMKRLALLGLSICSVATYVDCPTTQEPTLTCTDFSMVVRPDTCEVFANPCGGQWVNPGATLPDGFVLFGKRASVSVRRDDSSGVTTRSICAASDAGNIDRQKIGFKYAYDTFDHGSFFGVGALTLTVSPRLIVHASATPSTIDSGDGSVLVAEVSGGIPPYSYNWNPLSEIQGYGGDSSVFGSALVTTTYDVTVTDHAGQVSHANVTVIVNVALVVTAFPLPVFYGGDTRLDARGTGGWLPVTFIWEPADSLNDATIADPVARPQTTTTYTVTGTDANGVSRTGSIEVEVSLLANSTASPGTIDAGQSAQLDANPLGGDGHYTYSWIPTTGLNDPAIRRPVASPGVTTTYTVTVTDGHGRTGTGFARVTVNATAPPPTAYFTFTRVPCTPTTPCSNGATVGQEVFLTSTSTGNIVQYSWEFDWTPASPDAVSSGPTTSVVLEEGNQRGNIILTVRAADGQTASISLRFP